jgi:hypothetical protein
VYDLLYFSGFSLGWEGEGGGTMTHPKNGSDAPPTPARRLGHGALPAPPSLPDAPPLLVLR